MTRTARLALYALLALSAIAVFLTLLAHRNPALDGKPTAEENYQQYCASCHGEKLEKFVRDKWKHGRDKAAIVKGIKYGYEDAGMPAFEETFSEEEVNALAVYLIEAYGKAERYGFDGKKSKAKAKYNTENFELRLETVAEGFENPWGLAFLPDGDLLLTDRVGKVYRIDSKSRKHEIEGAPDVLSENQGGLLDVELHPDFATNRYVYFSYSAYRKQGQETLSTTQVVRAELRRDRLKGHQVIFTAEPWSTKRHHYGSRMEFDREGRLYVSVGDRGARDDNPQYLDNHCGKIHRINEDGTIPADNPFAGQEGVRPSIYSFGHRNPQGISLHPETGELWENEHGPRGGDEINRIRPGENYGWPEISYGINYNGTTFTNDTAQQGMIQPELYWVPSIAPCGMTFVRGDRYPGWQGDILSGSLRFKHVNRAKMDGEKVVGEEQVLENVGRVRLVEESPDGWLYVATEEPGVLYKLVPEGE